MESTVAYDAEWQFLDIQVRGEYALTDALGLLTRVLAAVREHRCHKLRVDLRAAQLRLGTMDLYHAPTRLAEAAAAADVDIHRLRRAVVLAEEHRDARFLETVAHNRGHAMRIFFDPDQAREWLLGP